MFDTMFYRTMAEARKSSTEERNSDAMAKEMYEEVKPFFKHKKNLFKAKIMVFWICVKLPGKTKPKDDGHYVMLWLLNVHNIGVEDVLEGEK